jgi:hypothetical protein
MNNREKKLLLGFAAICLIAVLIIGGYRLNLWNQQIKQETVLLTDQITTAQYWLERQEELDAKGMWMREHLPTLASRNESTSALISLIQSTSQQHQLTIERQEVVEPENDSPDVRIRMETNAPIQTLILWLNDLQKPENMVAIPEIEIKPQADDEKIKATLTICRYFRKPETSSPAP